ncbi:MAG: hypothetical protein WAQ53_13570 [Thiofilum sp.]|uniref:hypothetical protein n=1 Tax=Thiofilum sp. TaxID=2212733 RepID=UPI0025E9226D|nr:hypothetical protein [Thiofilum sp.]MBK8453614.1 hypothetical protein [Thiofilum sp.]
MPTVQKNQTISLQSFNFIELSKSTTPRYDAPMPIELGINAEIASSCNDRGDHNRQHAGGGHKPVSYPNGGMSGVRRLQHGLDRNTRIVSSGATTTPDNSGCKLKLDRVTIMTALSACTSKAFAYPANLTYLDTQTGVIAYQDGLPVAWIVLGFHKGQLNNQPHTSRFVDVVYYRATYHGVNLETFEADSLEQALQALEVIFSDLPYITQKAELIRLFATPQPTQPLNKATLKANNPFTSPAVEVAA